MVDVEAVRNQARWMAMQRLYDVCEAWVDNPQAGEGVRDPVTGEVTYPDPKIQIYGPGIEPYHGACRVRMSAANAAIMPGPDGMIALTISAIVVPHDVVFRRGTDIKVVESDNPAALGVERTIRAEHTGSQQSSNKYGFEELA